MLDFIALMLEIWCYSELRSIQSVTNIRGNQDATEVLNGRKDVAVDMGTTLSHFEQHGIYHHQKHLTHMCIYIKIVTCPAIGNSWKVELYSVFQIYIPLVSHLYLSLGPLILLQCMESFYILCYDVLCVTDCSYLVPQVWVSEQWWLMIPYLSHYCPSLLSHWLSKRARRELEAAKKDK